MKMYSPADELRGTDEAERWIKVEHKRFVLLKLTELIFTRSTQCLMILYL